MSVWQIPLVAAAIMTGAKEESGDVMKVTLI